MQKNKILLKSESTLGQLLVSLVLKEFYISEAFFKNKEDRKDIEEHLKNQYTQMFSSLSGKRN